MHEFTWRPRRGFAAVDDPRGAGGTTVERAADHGDLVGFNTGELLTPPQRPTVETVPMQAMPQGAVTIGRDRAGQLTATVNAFGLTPGSPHTVRILTHGRGVFASLGTLTADGAGRADAALSAAAAGRIPDGSRLVIGVEGGLDGGLDAAAGAIAQTPVITVRWRTYQLGALNGGPRGWVNIAYYPTAKTATVTLNASGLSPGAHAARIHLGSCRSQGPVLYTLMDFVANGAGQIKHQVRTVTGVTSPIPASGWHLNLLQGNSDNILANGRPTANFRPLLCADI